ncbi:DUF4335 domain-containing protein [Oculatella sp. LEGE 06141]|uniref:DUF4335 domain-containing protein n=1 Tax=Oculatella sp. LEGE 06141 TaxID=1828648 RepID=UPI00187FCFDF|nr:DUF4335 domain-containing protein [Oculatella sp. LEGE 06141]MBE9181228.1 DUF4335 domain-containing protein [Oculatella sp. LEGE 06141]
MTIQRQYSLPNCKLVLEGLSDDSTVNSVSGRPLISVLINAECHFTGQEQPISGGRDFLESLVTAVSHYAQECLSGVTHPAAHGHKAGLVQFQKLAHNLHRLSVLPQSENGELRNGHSSTPLQLDLRTVQLFDLVEAIDQFLVDTQTLPDLGLDLKPASKRNVVAQEPIAKRALPAALGVSSLAVAAVALFFVPIPERRPEVSRSNSGTEQTTNGALTPSAAAPGTTEPPANLPVEGNANSSRIEAATTSGGSAAAEDTERSPSVSSSPPSAEELSNLLTTSPEITDPDEVTQLNQRLRDQLDAAWTQTPDFDEDLVYRVAVAENGDILGFRYGNDAALTYVNETPLLDLRYNPVTEASSTEPLAQFRIVFTPEGAIEVSPWHGRVDPPDETP